MAESRVGSSVVKWLLGVIIVLCLVAGLYMAIVLNWSFSKGERIGYVQKVSERGWVCKTFEGELQILPLPGAIPEKFYFSVRNQGVVEQINRSLGKKVALIYEQHKGLPGTCLGETEYFIVGVRVLD